MRVVVIVNQASGTAAGGGGVSADDLERRFRTARVQAIVRVVEQDRIVETVRCALGADADAIVVGGGDGTINTVAGALAGKSMPLGVLPLGTHNHFAQDLGIPLDLDEAIRCIAQGHQRAVDLGEVNGRVFVNNSSIGAYPHIVSEREEQRQRFGRPKWLATLVAGLNVFRRWPLLRVKLALDGATLARTTPFVFVGNNEYTTDLFNIGARRCLDAGRLCVYTANCPNFLALVRLAWHAVRGRLEQARDFEAHSTRELWVHPHKKHVRVSLDGEVVRMETPLRYRIRPRNLLVFAPAPTSEPAPG